MAMNSGGADMLPGVTVVLRSYNRYASLLRLLDALGAQDHPDYEIVVIEQSDLLPAQREELDGRAAADPRLRIVYSRPLGVGGAREAGWRASRKEIVLAIDDDDVPLGEGFVSGHARNYLDPTIVAVTGRHVYSPDETCDYADRDRARRLCLRYNWFGYPHVYCRFDERIDSVHWVHGTNGSVRKSVIERVGGWDARSMEHDEHPFCLRLQRRLEPGERLVFDPTIVLLRTKDAPGGASVRFEGSRRIFRMWIRYYHGLVMKHRPLPSVLLYPIFPLAASMSALRFIWVDSKVHKGTLARILATVGTSLCLPVWYAVELKERLTGESRRYPG
jgi:glycosyltransferase involved in cell wall biosynthesis